MRIRQDRLDSNVRVTQAETTILKAVDSILENVSDITSIELIEALGRVQSSWIQNVRNAETPVMEQR